jgi:hypothetical protein
MPRSLAYRMSDFIATTIPARGEGRFGPLLAHSVIAFLQVLEVTQETNPWVTLTLYGSNGLWVLFKGRRVFMVLPTRQHLRIVSDCYREEGENLLRLINSYQRAEFFKNTRGQNPYYQWSAFSEGIYILGEFVNLLPVGDTFLVDQPGHPRTFPGEVRESALLNFERSGRWCPGVPLHGRKRHQVNIANGEAVEFDHILPHARGGANGYFNIQVLCQECNRVKRATAL